MRLARLAVLSLLMFAPATLAYANEPGGAPSSGEEPTAWDGTTHVGKGEVSHERPVMSDGTKNGRSWNSDPVVGENKNGRLYDKRNGQFLSKDNAKDARERGENYENDPKGVTLYQKDGEGTTGINVGPIKDGSVNLAEGKYGSVDLNVGQLYGEYTAGVGVTKDGVTGRVQAYGQVTLVGLSAETKDFKFGNEELGGDVRARGNAFIGADGTVDGSLAVGKNGVNAHGKAEVFAGGKATGQVAGSLTICGVSIAARGEGEVSYGIGATAEGYFKVDWSTMTVKIGGKAALTFGGGAGAGGEVEISLQKLIENPSMAANCAWEGVKKVAEAAYEGGKELVSTAYDLGKQGVAALSSAADTVGSTLSNAGDTLASAAHHLCFWCSDDKPKDDSGGSNVARNAVTVPPGDSNSGGGATPIYGQKR